jgi:sulfate adenylyltransferase
MIQNLIEPHGGHLVNLVLEASEASKLLEEAQSLPSWTLSQRQICDLELLMNGGFSPLNKFMNQAEYEAVRDDMHLPGGVLWPIPIVLDITEDFANQVGSGNRFSLCDDNDNILAVMTLEEHWTPDRNLEAEKVYLTTNPEHKGVEYLLEKTNPVYASGKLEGIELPRHYDSRDIRLTPRELRESLTRLGWRKVIAFQTRNPMHRAHFELTVRAVREHEANLLIHPAVGLTKPGDVPHYTRVRCYQALMRQYPLHTVKLSLLPLSMRMLGPREALWHALIRKNFGCTHFIVGRDHAGPGKDSSGKDFYGPYDAQEMMIKYQDETGIEMVPFRLLVFAPERDEYIPIDEVPEGVQTLMISGTQLRKRLNEGRDLPEWFTFPEVANELRRTYPPRYRQGFTVMFTGLPQSGKSTLAKVLMAKLLELGGRPVTLLDGDIVRENLSSELSFSREDRNTNITRVGFVAKEITKNGGIAICAPIAPYSSVRKQVREMITPHGGFIMVHVSTPLEVCETRDKQGLYAKARAGDIEDFTGISDPYEEPVNQMLSIDTSNITPEEGAQMILLHLEREGYVGIQRN